jgi:CheY-like chemotaxis protein
VKVMGEMTTIALSALRVLAVDNDVNEARQLQDVLASFGCLEVEYAYTGGGAILLADQLRPDLVIMNVDLTRPSDGIRAASEIHARFGIQTLFVSRRNDDSLRQSALAAGLIGWLRKPYAVEDLQLMLLAIAPRLMTNTKVLFRRASEQQTWHWCSDCSTWPGPAVPHQECDSLPLDGELCSECCVKSVSSSAERARA